MSRKTLLIGLDGASFDLLEPWIRQGKLAVFSSILERGVHGILKSTIPCQTCPAVPSLYTGKNPGNTGLFSFLDPDGNLVTSATLPDKPLWEILNEHGKRVVVLNLQTTYPAEKIDGAMVCHTNHPEGKNDLWHPADLAPLLSDFYQGTDDFNREHDLLYDGDETGVRQTYELVEKRYEIFERIIDRIDPQFAVFWIAKSDDVHHFSWRHPDRILEFYQHMEKLLKRIIDTHDDTDILIVSDHGVADMPEHTFAINEWLSREGYFVRRTSLTTAIKCRIRSFLLAHLPVSILNKLVALRERRAQKKDTTTVTTEKAVLVDMRAKLVDVDWKTTRAYCENAWGIRLNRKIVDSNSKEFDTLRDEIIRQMKELTIDGVRIFREVHTRKELYPGKYVEQLPDIIFTLGPKLALDRQEYGGLLKPYKPRAKYGYHTYERDGIFIGVGPDFKRNHRTAPMEIYDIPPLILFLNDLPVPKDFDGSVHKEILAEDSAYAGKDVEYTDARSIRKRKVRDITEREREEMMDSLRALGYLDE
ncbi:MAG: alkaline phosphatase family protein [bacterium]|nr:MAG: alkaline phosphatase family protein [bacterium]